MAVGSRDHREPSIKHLSCLIIRSRVVEAVPRELAKGETVRFLSLLSLRLGRPSLYRDTEVRITH